MAKVLRSFEFKRGGGGTKKPTPRLKVVYRILDAWGQRLIKEFPYADRDKAMKALDTYHRQGFLAYYLRP